MASTWKLHVFFNTNSFFKFPNTLDSRINSKNKLVAFSFHKNTLKITYTGKTAWCTLGNNWREPYADWQIWLHVKVRTRAAFYDPPNISPVTPARSNLVTAASDIVSVV